MIPKRSIRGNYASSDRKFDIWLTNRLNENSMTLSEVAEKIGITRQAMSAYKDGRLHPPLYTTIAICWAFGMNDDPEYVYNLVKEDCRLK